MTRMNKYFANMNNNNYERMTVNQLIVYRTEDPHGKFVELDHNHLEICPTYIDTKKFLGTNGTMTISVWKDNELTRLINKTGYPINRSGFMMITVVNNNGGHIKTNFYRAFVMVNKTSLDDNRLTVYTVSEYNMHDSFDEFKNITIRTGRPAKNNDSSKRRGYQYSDESVKENIESDIFRNFREPNPAEAPIPPVPSHE